MNFKQSILSLLSTYITLVALFVLGRTYWFLSFVKPNFFADTSIWDTLYVFLMSMRLDSSVSVLLILIPFIGSFLLSFIKIAQSNWGKFQILYVYVTLFSTALLIILNHYYFYYYKAHFNLFFWEFWQNWENSMLVIWSIFDELPIFSVFASIACFVVIGYITYNVINNKLNKLLPEQQWLFKIPGLLIWVLLIAIAGRATLDKLPLTLQFNRGLISTNMFLNQTHSNPIHTLYFSWQTNDDTELINSIIKRTETLENVKQYFDLYSYNNKYRSVKQNGTSLKIQYTVPALQSKYLRKRPKHIIVIFMESFFAWPLEIDENRFNYNVAGNFLKLKEEGLYFSNYFRAASGTYGNIFKTILGIPTPRELSLENLREQYNDWDTFPRVMKKNGYRPKFFYGGSLGWHRLNHFLEESGFEDIYGENSVNDVPHTRFGISDEHLFDFVHDNLQKAANDTFNFVMTLSNHPPYQVPDSYKYKDIKVPNILKPYAKDKEYFYKRFNAYNYSDTALGHFIKRAKTSEYFKDTLFIITADHPVDYFSNWDFISRYKLEKLPLLLYSPLLFEHNTGNITNRGTHLDLLPTILSIINDQPQEITNWGKTLLLNTSPDYLNSYYLNCINNFCITPSGKKLLDNKQNFTKCSRQKCLSQEQALTYQSKAFEMSGIHYLLNH